MAADAIPAPTNEQLEEIGHQLIEKCKAALDLKWDKISTEKGVTVYRHTDPGSPVNFMRGETTIQNISASELLILLSNPEVRKNYDPMIIGSRDVQLVRDDHAGFIFTQLYN